LLPRFLLIACLLNFASWVRAERVAGLAGLDTGTSAVGMLKLVEASPDWYGAGLHPWLRIRGIPDPTNPANEVAVANERAALARLKQLGFRTMTFLRWDNAVWTAGIRGGGGQRVPLDLREAYTRSLAYGRAYGAVTSLELDNEPDIAFVEDNPETYAAFLKTCYLGAKEGAREAANASNAHPASSWRNWGRSLRAWLRRNDRASGPWVVMAPLALPPGPYLEQLVANGLFTATDAFNYHYYGYAEDFTGTYRQFESLVSEYAQHSPHAGARQKSLPVVLTEYGYGSLSDVTRDTVAGRVRQWSWFKSVGTQIETLRIEGPMAFYLQPYLETKAVEFGLTTPAIGVSAAAAGNAPQHLRAGRVEYTAADFAEGGAAAKEQPWMHSIGRKVGEHDATPALAWLLDEATAHPYRAHDWRVPAVPASPVVIDFIATRGLAQIKRYTGSMLFNIAGSVLREGAGDVVLYNFSAHAVSGRLRSEQPGTLRVAGLVPDGRVTLAPGERRVLPITFSLETTRFARVPWSLRFEPVDETISPAAYVTAFYPEASKMKETVVTRFTDAGPEIEPSRAAMEAVPLAREEVVAHREGRWHVTDGVSVTESKEGLWRFSIAAFPNGEPRPSVAELPLRGDFVFPDDAMMRFVFRLAEPAGATVENGRYCEAYFRTANGNLYQVWPRQYAIGAWSGYTEAKENYTMAFYGRANLPWRFRENRPVALVFRFRPGTAPAVYEVKDARIVMLGE
jgi:hypothetical protein